MRLLSVKDELKTNVERCDDEQLLKVRSVSVKPTNSLAVVFQEN